MVGMRLKSWPCRKDTILKVCCDEFISRHTTEIQDTCLPLSRLPSFCLHNWLLKSLVDLCFNYSEFGIHLICKLSLMYLFSELGTGLSKRHSLRKYLLKEWENVHLPMAIARQRNLLFMSCLLFVGEGLVWDFLYEFGKCWEILFLVFNFRFLFLHRPQDRSLLRNIKKPCSDFRFLINLLPVLSFFICLLLFPLGLKEVLYLRNDSLLLGHRGLWKPHDRSFTSNPPIYNHGGKLDIVLGVINDFTKLNLCPSCVHFSKTYYSKSLPLRTHLSLVWHLLHCISFQSSFLT